MSGLQGLDMRTLLETGVTKVFETMLSMELETMAENVPSLIEGDRIVGSVSFAGKVMGSIGISVGTRFGKILTASLLGMEPDEIEGEDEVNDVIGELSNMIGGNLKSRLCDSGFPCELSIPCITTGKDFRIESRDWTVHERLGFKNKNHVAVVDVYAKTAS